MNDPHSRLVESLKQRVPEDALSYIFSRSGGPGGQNVNKVNTRVMVKLRLDAGCALDERERNMVYSQLRTRINRNEELFVVSWRFRTQLANRRAARERLFELLASALRPVTPRRPTKIPKASRRRRLTEKRGRGETKRLRNRPTRDEAG